VSVTGWPETALVVEAATEVVVPAMPTCTPDGALYAAEVEAW
jgi:hypothetical protein